MQRRIACSEVVRHLTCLSGLVLLLYAGLFGPVRVDAQSDTSGQRSNLTHRTLIEQASVQRGRELYRSACIACHGSDGKASNNPRARSFVGEKLQNGADPLSMYRTLTEGYKTMPTMNWLSPQERYDVIRYVRQEMLKPENPDQFEPVTEAYLSSLPDTVDKRTSRRRSSEGGPNFGPGLSWRFGGAPAALTIDLGGGTTISYDLQRMRVLDVWRGGFLDLSDTMMERRKGGSWPKKDGQSIKGLRQWQWALNGKFGLGPDDSDRWSPRGPAPTEWMQFKGRYRHGHRTILSYRIGDRDVLEVPSARKVGERFVLEHTLEIAPGEDSLKLAAGRAVSSTGTARGIYTYDGELRDRRKGQGTKRTVLVTGSTKQQEQSGDGTNSYEGAVIAAVVGQTKGVTWSVDEQDRLVLHLPASGTRRVLQVIRSTADTDRGLQQFSRYVRTVQESRALTPPSEWTTGGPRQWTEEVTVQGEPGEPKNGYALDTVPVPFDNPYGTWMRTSAVDFFQDGRAVVTTYTGDVWIVSGLDEELDKVTWSRYAAGLYEPLGVYVEEETVYVTCRTGIVRLHDLNGNGEADFYETFYADPNVRTHWHMFNFDLQRGPDGHFYYAKTGLFNDFQPPPGAVRRVAPDGSGGEVVATGFRVPNGMGMLPDERALVSDNEGGWVPASQINVVEDGEFYGYPLGKPPAGPKGDYRPPDRFNDPMIWIPQSLDPSSGGQLWVEDGFGPLSETLLHTSYGTGTMSYVLRQESGGEVDAALIAGLPHEFQAGVHRARQNPATGHVWGTGLSGWGGPADAEDGCFQRLRYTGGNARFVKDFQVSKQGIELQFSVPLDPEITGNVERYALSQWNYRWTHNYGSAHYSVENPEQEGEDPVPISGVQVGNDRQTVHLSSRHLQPVDQLRIRMDLEDAGGRSFSKTVHLTIHRVPANTPSNWSDQQE